MVWMRMGESPDDKNPLISVTYADDVWNYINALNCENAAQEGISGKSKIDLYPNPVVRGGDLQFSTFFNVRNGYLRCLRTFVGASKVRV